MLDLLPTSVPGATTRTGTPLSSLLPGRRPDRGPGPATVVPRIPDQDEFARLWSQVPSADRRRILRAVNRGAQVDSRKEAALAVVLARRQQRFWRYAWLMGPLIALPLSSLLGIEGPSIIGYALLGGAVLLAMSAFYTRRAKQAEEVNADHAIHGRRR